MLLSSELEPEISGLPITATETAQENCHKIFCVQADMCVLKKAVQYYLGGI